MPPSQTMREEKGGSAHREVNRLLAAAASKLGINASMAFTLYNAPQSTCSQRVRFVLNAKALPFSEVKLNLLEGDQLKPDYLKLNPNGVVPTLDHDGAIIIDSTVITEYLDEVSQANSFTPEHPVERARMRALMHFIDEMPAPAVRVPTFNLAFLPSFQKMSAEAFRAMAESKPLRKEFMLKMGQTGFPKAEMLRHSTGCAAATSAWRPKSPAAAGRGCSARPSRWPMSLSCPRWSAWTTSACRRSGLICLALCAGTITFARTRLSSRPIIMAHC